MKQEQEKLEKEMRSKMDEEVKMKEESLKTQLSIELQQLQHEREQVCIVSCTNTDLISQYEICKILILFSISIMICMYDDKT